MPAETVFPNIKSFRSGKSRPHGSTEELLAMRPLIALVRPVFEIPDVVLGVYYAALCGDFLVLIKQSLCLLVFDSFLKYLRVSCKFKLL